MRDERVENTHTVYSTTVAAPQERDLNDRGYLQKSKSMECHRLSKWTLEVLVMEMEDKCNDDHPQCDVMCL